MAKNYTVTDGKLVLTLHPAGGGWYAVTSPFDPGITTQARTVEEAYLMTYDALKALRASRAKSARRADAPPSEAKATAHSARRSNSSRRPTSP
jgi:antitoxin HicB